MLTGCRGQVRAVTAPSALLAVVTLGRATRLTPTLRVIDCGRGYWTT